MFSFTFCNVYINVFAVLLLVLVSASGIHLGRPYMCKVLVEVLELGFGRALALRTT